MDPRRSSGIDQDNFRILDSDDLHRGQVRDRHTIPRLDADGPDIDDARGRYQVGVPLGVQGQGNPLARLDGCPHHPRIGADGQRIVTGKPACQRDEATRALGFSPLSANS
jgi:hypothetical protein